MVELIAYRGGEQRSLVFGQPLRATALDTLVAPDGREFSLGPGQSAAGPDGLRIGHACTLEGTSDFHRVVLSHRSGHREERFGLGSAKDTLFALGPGHGVKVLGRSETGLRFLAGPSATLR